MLSCYFVPSPLPHVVAEARIEFSYDGSISGLMIRGFPIIKNGASLEVEFPSIPVGDGAGEYPLICAAQQEDPVRAANAVRGFKAWVMEQYRIQGCPFARPEQISAGGPNP